MYAGEPEDLTHSCPHPMGKPVLITSFVDDNLMADLTTGISHARIIDLMNKTPIKCYSKSQSCVKNSTYSSNYIAARICTDYIVDFYNTLRYLFPLSIWSMG